MLRLDKSSSDSDDIRRLSNAAVIGNALTFVAVCLSIHFSPYVLEQFGIEAVV